jgi:hydrogenase maturation protease
LTEAKGNRTTAVLGLGNVLMGDDALGPTVIARLCAAYRLPPEVAVEDLGTPGLDLHPHLAGHAALIVVDTVRADAAPGTLRRYDKEDILRHAPGPRLSPHDPGLKDALLWLRFSGDEPEEVVLVGVVPASCEGAVGLSEPVTAALPEAEAAVIAELRRLGHVVARREPPDEPDLWWESR